MVLRSPVPSGQRSFREWNGSTSHAIHIRETMENPTYVVTDISEPFRRFNIRAYKYPQTAASTEPATMANMKPPHPGMPSSMVNRPTRPIGRPRFKLMPHWIPGTIARTMMAFMPMRTTVLLNRVDKDRSYHRVIKHSRIKNTPMMTLGIPSFATRT